VSRLALVARDGATQSVLALRAYLDGRYGTAAVIWDVKGGVEAAEIL